MAIEDINRHEIDCAVVAYIEVCVTQKLVLNLCKVVRQTHHRGTRLILEYQARARRNIHVCGGSAVSSDTSSPVALSQREW